METEKIKITLAGKSHGLQVDSSKVELYHHAERLVNASIVKFEQRNYDGLRPQDIVALAAFEFAIANVKLRQQNELDSEEMASLRNLDTKIEEYMNDLRQEKIYNK